MEEKDDTTKNQEEITLDPGTTAHTEPPEDDSCLDRLERYWKYLKKSWNSEKGYKLIVVCCVIFFILGIVAAIIGGLHFGKCNLSEGSLLYWLVAFGPCCTILSLVVGIERYVRSIRKRKNYLIQCNCFQRILGLLIFCGYIAGFIFVFGSSRSSDPESDAYCHAVPYFFAVTFLVLFSVLVLLIIGILLSLCRRV